MRILTIIGALAASTLLGGWTFRSAGRLLPTRRATTTNCGYPSLQACVVTRAAPAALLCRTRNIVERRYAERRSKSGRLLIVIRARICRRLHNPH